MKVGNGKITGAPKRSGSKSSPQVSESFAQYLNGAIDTLGSPSQDDQDGHQGSSNDSDKHPSQGSDSRATEEHKRVLRSAATEVCRAIGSFEHELDIGVLDEEQFLTKVRDSFATLPLELRGNPHVDNLLETELARFSALNG